MQANAQLQIPLERYRELLAALDSERGTWVEDFWLRFAAHAAVLCPGPAEEVARDIREDAAKLQRHAGWYQRLASPARFVVAALLRQHHIAVDEFMIEHERIGRMLHTAGLRRGDFQQLMTVLILHLTPRPHPLAMTDIERLRALYSQMKRFHWWLTGPEDVPACAALASCPGRAEDVVAQAEKAYQQLHAAGLTTGDDLQTAANLLPLVGQDIDRVVTRYCELVDVLQARIGKLNTWHYEGVAVLALLDHPAERVADTLQAINRELDLLQPREQGMVNFVISADLTVLDLVRFDHAHQPITDPQRMEAMLDTLHRFHLASAVLVSQMDEGLILPLALPDHLGWPYGVA